MRQNVQPPGSPETAVNKRGFKSKGNPAAVEFDDFFRHQSIVKIGQKIDESFFAKFERRKQTRDQVRNNKNLKRMQDFHKKTKEPSKNVANRNVKKMQTTAGNPSKVNSLQRQFPNKNRAFSEHGRPPRATRQPHGAPIHKPE